MSEIQLEDLKQYKEAFVSDKANILAMNAVTTKGLKESCTDWQAKARNSHEFSVKLDQHGITWQHNSGRCWMFAGFNCLRDKIIKDLNLEFFSFSGNYLMFYDKMEKANLFLETVIEKTQEPLNGRLMEKLLRGLRSDGGEWEMFASLVMKYGMVPADVQPEAVSNNESRNMAHVVALKLREFAKELRGMAEDGKDEAERRSRKEEMLAVIYRMYAICYGEPVQKFDFEVRAKDGTFIRDNDMTPREFYKKYIGIDLNHMVSLVCGSSEGREMKKYQYQNVGDVIEGIPVAYISVPIKVLKEAAIAQMKAGKPVWFGCDVGEASERKSGILDTAIYDYESLFNTSMGMTKPERFQYGQANMSHAMVFKGVNLDNDGKPNRWCVENTWGPEPGKGGMFTMTDEWFEQYTYQVIVERCYVPAEILDAWDHMEPEILDAWVPHV